MDGKREGAYLMTALEALSHVARGFVAGLAVGLPVALLLAFA